MLFQKDLSASWGFIAHQCNGGEKIRKFVKIILSGINLKLI